MMTDFDYFDYEDDEEDGNDWNWFYVSMYDMDTGQPAAQSWPVFTQGFDAAMDVYQLLLKASK